MGNSFHGRAGIRTAGRAVVIIGLLLFYISLALNLFVDAPEELVQAGVSLTALGCLWLAAVLALPSNDKRSVTLEALLAFLCLPLAFLSMFAASGDETELQMPWLIIAVFIFVGLVLLLGQAARVRRAEKSWRNSDRDA